MSIKNGTDISTLLIKSRSNVIQYAKMIFKPEKVLQCSIERII